MDNSEGSSKRTVLLIDRLGAETLSTLLMKGQDLHRACAFESQTR